MPRLKLSALDAHRKTFSDFLNYRAVQVGTTIGDIGDSIGVSRSSIQKYKHNPGTMRVDDLLKLSNVLNMDAATLLKVYTEGKTPWEQKEAQA